MSAEWGPRTPFASAEPSPTPVQIRRERSTQPVPRLYLTPNAFCEARVRGVHLGVGESALRLAKTVFDQELTPEELAIVVYVAADDPDDPDHPGIFEVVAARQLEKSVESNFAIENIDTPHALFVPAGDWSQESLLTGFKHGLQRRGAQSVQENKAERAAAAIPIAAAMFLDGYLNQRPAAVLALGAGAGISHLVRQRHRQLQKSLTELLAAEPRFSTPLFVGSRSNLNAAA